MLFSTFNGTVYPNPTPDDISEYFLTLMEYLDDPLPPPFHQTQKHFISNISSLRRKISEDQISDVLALALATAFKYKLRRGLKVSTAGDIYSLFTTTDLTSAWIKSLTKDIRTEITNTSSSLSNPHPHNRFWWTKWLHTFTEQVDSSAITDVVHFLFNQRAPSILDVTLSDSPGVHRSESIFYCWLQYIHYPPVAAKLSSWIKENIISEPERSQTTAFFTSCSPFKSFNLMSIKSAEAFFSIDQHFSFALFKFSVVEAKRGLIKFPLPLHLAAEAHIHEPRITLFLERQSAHKLLSSSPLQDWIERLTLISQSPSTHPRRHIAL